LKRLVPNFLLKSLVSPPARGRGLKRCCDTSHTGAGESPPARGRGLKHSSPTMPRLIRVAPRTGAWIETLKPNHAPLDPRRPPHGGVD